MVGLFCVGSQEGEGLDSPGQSCIFIFHGDTKRCKVFPCGSKRRKVFPCGLAVEDYLSVTQWYKSGLAVEDYLTDTKCDSPPRSNCQSVPSHGRLKNCFDDVSDDMRDPPEQQSIYIPPGDNRLEQYRLSTFEHYPISSPTTRKSLAKAGFYFTGFFDRVKCFSCARTEERWNDIDNPSNIRWHKAYDFGNIPIKSLFNISNTQASSSRQQEKVLQQIDQSTGNILRTVRYPADLPERVRQTGGTFEIGPNNRIRIQTGPGHQVPGNVEGLGTSTPQPIRWRMANVISSDHRRFLTNLHLIRELDRLASFAQWPVGRPSVSPTALARTGFFYLGDMDRTQCFSCGGGSRNWTLEDDAMAEHRSHFPNCKMVLGTEQRNYKVNEFPDSPADCARGYPCRFPSNPYMKNEVARRDTFDRRWPVGRTAATPAEISQAGFFFIGEQDRVKCWYCNGGLQDWEYDDMPWIEHAEWFPTCQFLLKVKGQHFVCRQLTLNSDIVKCFSCATTVEEWDEIDNPSDIRWHKAYDFGNIPIKSLFNISNTQASSSRQQEKVLQQIDQSTGNILRTVRYPADLPERVRQTGGTFEIGPNNRIRIQTGPGHQVPGNVEGLGTSTPQPIRWRMANVISSDHRRFLTNLHLYRELDRLASFAPWPVDRPNVSPAALARTGFFYLGDMDRTQCFFCGGVLRNWHSKGNAEEEVLQQMDRITGTDLGTVQCPADLSEKIRHTEDWEYDDMPWVEHAKWFPTCQFLLQVKGQHFVYRHSTMDSHFARLTITKQGATHVPRNAGTCEISSRPVDILPPSCEHNRPHPSVIDLQEELNNTKEERMCKICFSNLTQFQQCTQAITQCLISRKKIQKAIKSQEIATTEPVLLLEEKAPTQNYAPASSGDGEENEENMPPEGDEDNPDDEDEFVAAPEVVVPPENQPCGQGQPVPPESDVIDVEENPEEEEEFVASPEVVVPPINEANEFVAAPEVVVPPENQPCGQGQPVPPESDVIDVEENPEEEEEFVASPEVVVPPINEANAEDQPGVLIIPEHPDSDMIPLEENHQQPLELPHISREARLTSLQNNPHFHRYSTPTPDDFARAGFYGEDNIIACSVCGLQHLLDQLVGRPSRNILWHRENCLFNARRRPCAYCTPAPSTSIEQCCEEDCIQCNQQLEQVMAFSELEDYFPQDIEMPQDADIRAFVTLQCVVCHHAIPHRRNQDICGVCSAVICEDCVISRAYHGHDKNRESGSRCVNYVLDRLPNN